RPKFVKFAIIRSLLIINTLYNDAFPKHILQFAVAYRMAARKSLNRNVNEP
ncbi:hypothetical protein HMPREF1870_02477, partial [Bacteroidales bacterium KA00344]